LCRRPDVAADGSALWTDGALDGPHGAEPFARFCREIGMHSLDRVMIDWMPGTPVGAGCSAAAAATGVK